MDNQKHLCVLIVLFLFVAGESLPALTPKVHVCDESRSDDLQEGNIGESGSFPWLGILRVYLHEYGQLKIAVTGLVLVKARYAIANAVDISKIPKTVFMQDSQAMFIPKRGEPWFARPKDYMIHPEFEVSTYNTIALVELELEEATLMPFKAVCWPGNLFNSSDQLYALGYTDDNKLMEKTLYSLQYVKPSLCREFYNAHGFTGPKSEPTYVQCGFAANNSKDCLWENGMAMASNSSGKWTLIGFGVRGPGCSVPARFIDMSAYLPWVETATDLEQNFQRKTAFNVGFRRQSTDDDAFTSPIERPQAIVEPYPHVGPETFKIYEMKPGLAHWFEMPLTVEEAGFGSFQRCQVPKLLVYRERMKLVETTSNGGKLEYRVTVYNRYLHNYTCIKLKIRNVISREPVQGYFNFDIGDVEGSSFTSDLGDSPSEILKYFPLPPKREPKEENEEEDTVDSKWIPGKHLEAKFIVDKANHTGIGNINIIMGFTFKGTATMDLRIYGHPHPRRFPTTTTTDDRRMNPRPPPNLKSSPKEFPIEVLRNIRENRKPQTPPKLRSDPINGNNHNGVIKELPIEIHRMKQKSNKLRTEPPKLRFDPINGTKPNGVLKKKKKSRKLKTPLPELMSNPINGNKSKAVLKELPAKIHRKRRKHRKPHKPLPKLRFSPIQELSFDINPKKRKSRLEKARERAVEREIRRREMMAFG